MSKVRAIRIELQESKIGYQEAIQKLVAIGVSEHKAETYVYHWGMNDKARRKAGNA